MTGQRKNRAAAVVAAVVAAPLLVAGPSHAAPVCQQVEKRRPYVLAADGIHESSIVFRGRACKGTPNRITRGTVGAYVRLAEPIEDGDPDAQVRLSAVLAPIGNLSPYPGDAAWDTADYYAGKSWGFVWGEDDGDNVTVRRNARPAKRFTSATMRVTVDGAEVLETVTRPVGLRRGDFPYAGK